jgi:hypothetical protein
MKRLGTFLAFMALSGIAATAPPLPIRSGHYVFQHRFAEQPDMRSVPLAVTIDGRHIVLVSAVDTAAFPKGVVAEGTLMWHAGSKQWIIGHTDADRHAAEVGGCSTGPDVVDLQKRIYWTC